MLLALALILGCTDGTTDTADTGTPAGETVKVSGLVFSFAGDVPLASGTACIDGLAEPCVDIGSDGTFVFDAVPVDTKSLLRLESEGQRSTLSAIVVGHEDVEVWEGLAPEEEWAEVMSVVGLSEDESKGQLITWVVPNADLQADDDMPGFAVTLSTSDAAGPLYSDVDDVFDPKATTTGPMGLAVFMNVAIGTWEATASRPGWTCQAHPWLNVATAGGIEVPIEAGWLTYVFAVCTRA